MSAVGLDDPGGKVFSVEALLRVPFARYSVGDLNQVLEDPGDLVWRGGTSRRGQPPKTGSFVIPNPLDPSRVPRPGSRLWESGAGIDASTVARFTTCFAELDPPTKPQTSAEALEAIREQLERVVTAVAAGLPCPTAIVLSGDPRGPEFTGVDVKVEIGKSTHIFWRGTEAVEFDTWYTIQAGLVSLLRGDPTTKSPVHRMRQGGVVSYVYGAHAFKGAPRPRVQTILWIGERVDLLKLHAAVAAYAPAPSGKPPSERAPRPHQSQASDLVQLRREDLDAGLRDRLNRIGDRLRPRIRTLIEQGHHEGDGYPSRSEADMGAVRGLVVAGATDDNIVAFFRLFPIGQKAREDGMGYLRRTIDRVRSSFVLVELVTFTVARNRLVLDLIETSTHHAFRTGIELNRTDVIEYARGAFGLRSDEAWIVAVGRRALVELVEKPGGTDVGVWARAADP